MSRCPLSGKVSYPDKKTALTAKNFQKKHGRAKELSVYQCPDFPHWHLTHRPRFRFKD